MSQTHEILIAGFQFPASTIIKVGDSVFWTNDDPDDHTATSVESGRFDTGEIGPGEQSDPILFNNTSDHSGFAYYCEVHQGMTATIIVEDDAVYSKADWLTMRDIIAANWVYDMADDFGNALLTKTGEDLTKITVAWDRIIQFWEAQVGPGVAMQDYNVLKTLSLSVLEQIGRVIRREYESLLRTIKRFPPINRPNGGQSSDPFGKAITIFSATAAERDAYLRQIRYVSSAYQIELDQDRGQPISKELKQQYQAAKQNVTVDDYLLVAEYQTMRLRALFGSNQFDAVKFDAGIWRMTLTGEWDQPPFTLWHWLRWIDAYLGVTADGVVPDLIPANVLAAP